jgi:hypothetical protein
MTTRGIRLALALALCLSLAAAASADASSQRLTRKEAKRMAVKLGRKQVRRFDLRFYRLGHPRRVGPRRIAFPYEARTAGNTYCKATLRVRKRSRGNRILLIARIGRQHCIHMPADALAVESATRKARRAFRKKATKRAVVAVLDEIFTCVDMNIPRKREVAAENIFISSMLQAFYRPNRAMFTKYADRLDAVDTTHVVLADGVAGFLDYVDILSSIPSPRHPCDVLRRWKRHHWAADEAPAGTGVRRDDLDALDDDFVAIDRAGAFLERVGVYVRLEAFFREGGLTLFDSPSIETDEIHLPMLRK